MAKYFNTDEFRCKCGKGCLPSGGIDANLIEILEVTREAVGEPIYITSGYRCPEHNRACGGASQSFHMTGKAADVYCDSLSVYELKETLKAAMDSLGIQGGLQEYPSQGFVHVDTRGYWAGWC